MNKRLVTTLIAGVGALAVQPAFAANLNVYGVAHGSIDSSDDGVTSSTYISSNSSRLGFSGSQDMDGGVSAIFQFETGVDLTGAGTNDGNGGASTANQLFTTTRDAFVGISGGFGAVKLGRVGGLNQWVYDVNYFGDQVGDLGNVWGSTGLPGRISNTISYDSPNWGGFSGTLVFQPESGLPEKTEIGVLKINFAGLGDGDALKVGLGFISVGEGNSAAVPPSDHSATALTGSYDFGMFNIGAGYQSDSDIGGVSGKDSDSLTLGGAVKIGNGTIKLQYTTISPDETTPGTSEDAAQVAIGYDHALNESATVYVAFASTDNDAGASVSATNYGHGNNVGVAAAGQDPSSFSIGFVYKFGADVME